MEWTFEDQITRPYGAIPFCALCVRHPASVTVLPVPDNRDNDRRISEAAQNARKGGGSKDLSLEAEQTAWLASNGIATTDSDAKYVWHCAPEAKVRHLDSRRIFVAVR